MNAQSLTHWIPALSWLRSYTDAGCVGDVLRRHYTGCIFAAAGLGDASLANLPPEAGLYACLFGGLFFLALL